MMINLNIQLEEYNKNLSELVGILLGDGSLSLRGVYSKTQNRLKISLNSIDDLKYSKHISKLIKKLFRVKPIVKKRKNENTLDLLLFNKKIVSFLIYKVGLALSPKWKKAIIPKYFLDTPYDLLVLRGYFDTDGCLVVTNNNGTIYPRLEMKVSPSPMQLQFIQILKKHKFRFGVYKIGKGKVRIQLNGKVQLKKWIDLIDFSNPKHTKKSRKFL